MALKFVSSSILTNFPAMLNIKTSRGDVLAHVQRHQSSPLFQPPFVHACTFKEHQNLFQQNKNAFFPQHAHALTYLLTSFFSLYQAVFFFG